MRKNPRDLRVRRVAWYVYAFVGGFTDAANAIATAVGTRAFKPPDAVLIVGVLEVLGVLSGTAVALMIGKGIVAPSLLTLHGVAVLDLHPAAAVTLSR